MKKLIAGTISLAALAACAIPQSPVVTYGQIRDEYGEPLDASSALALKLVKAADPDGQVYASTTVGETTYPGMNYRLSLEIDSDGPSRYYAVLTNTTMRIRFFIDGVEQAATPVPTFDTPANGTAQRLDYSIGEDADGDGLPDAWEAWVLQLAGLPHDAAAVAAFSPAADSDGDGMSNYREFLAGTDPFLSTDLFEITHFVKTGEGNRTEIGFTTVPDRTYRIVTAAALGSESTAWVPVAASKTPTGATSYGAFKAEGLYLTVYIDAPAADAGFFRVVSQ